MRAARRAAALRGAAALLWTVPGTAGAAGTPAFSGTTAIGTHNAYDKAKYTYFAQALDSGASLLELDVYTDPLSRRWRVSHSNPLGDDSDCEAARTPAELYGSSRNQDLGSCLDDIAAWHRLHPDHRPIVFKVEMKNGFDNNAGLGPDEFDTLVRRKLGDLVYTPSDLLGGAYPSLDAAARAGAWPSRQAPTGRVLFELIPGTVLWIADYVTAGHPRIKARWRFHQYTDEPRDKNVANFAGRAELRKWAAP